MTTFYVLRHGEVAENRRGIINGHNAGALTPRGREQARAVRPAISHINPDAVICSPLARAVETCQLAVRANYPVSYDDRLAERNPHHLMHQPSSILDPAIWYDPTKTVVYGDAEGFGSILSRTHALLSELTAAHPDQTLLLVTHGDVCRAIHLYFYPDASPITFHQGNCALVSYHCD